ncbi:MAG TPA: hypothetical protein VFR86_08695 [Burkholderiaceae bacterium]|nr:hypothetical protein [Burkholderiaceae bacterium]
MSSTYAAHGGAHKRRRRKKQHRSLAARVFARAQALLPSARKRGGLVRALRAAPPALRFFLMLVMALTCAAAFNWVYQVFRKPTELYFPVSGVLNKTPAETWRQYQRYFRAHSTNVMTAEFLAALAQVEGSGNPVARTYWRLQASWNPFEWYRPASSAVGMYQITDATFVDAKRYCIRDHAVVERGPWHDLRACWFNGLYTRVVPGHAVEMTAALLDRRVAAIVQRRRDGVASLQQKQDLAALIHLCGARAGEEYARRNFQLNAGQRCGTHDARSYLARVMAMRRFFARLAAGAY